MTALQRLERLAQQAGRGHLSPQELLLLQAQITRLPTTIPSDVLNSYDTIKRHDPKAFVDPQLFALMVLLAVIAVWAGQRPRHSDFQDHPGRVTFRVRRVKWPSGANPMARTVSGVWALQLELPAGKHQYLFTVDGKWVPDPKAMLSHPNSHGGTNSVILV